VDCYKKENIAYFKNKKIFFIDYILFVSFFPQLIAGPIVHHKEMIPQFSSLFDKYKVLVHWEFAAKGLFIFIIGLFKKIYIADSFAIYANQGFEIVYQGGILNIIEAWVVSLCYTFQIYFDFSGYCDMAIGLGLLFGVLLPINFNSPYKALNIADFWHRWHITLGKFFKAYLYIPLGGNRLGKLLNLRNLIIVAFLSGIWHGAGWGFVIWGLLHGLALCVHRIFNWIKPQGKFFDSRIYKFLMCFLTFNFVNISWIFFRAEDLQSALSLIKSMLGITWVELPYKFYSRLKSTLMQIDGGNETLFLLVFAFIICFCLKNSVELMRNLKTTWFYVLMCLFLFYLALAKLIAIPYVEFIYFNF